MAITFTYNGITFGVDAETESEVLQLTDYRARAMLLDDGVTHFTTQHEVNVSTVITAGAQTLPQKINTIRARLLRQNRHLKISIGSGTTGVWVEIGSSGDPFVQDDILNSPRIENVVITEIMGTRSALLSFTAVWHKMDQVSGDGALLDVMGHWWRTEMDFDVSGYQTWTTTGQLKVRPTADVPSGAITGVNRGPNPDVYRTLVIPPLPSGFRVDSAKWSIDETGTMLGYEVKYQQHGRNLPAPATDGDGDFSFDRSMQGLQAGMIGLKTFDAWLEGPPGVDRNQLLGALIAASSKRIKYAGQGMDNVIRLQVREGSIFSRNRIELRVEAIGVGNPFNAVGGSFLFPLGSRIVDPGSASLGFPVYGSPLIRFAQRQLFEQSVAYSESTFPRAGAESAVSQGVTQQFYTPDIVEQDQIFTEMLDDPEHKQLADAGHANRPYIQVQVSERFRVGDTGLRRAGSRALNTPDRVFQLWKPQVFVESMISLTRVGFMPEHFRLSPPPGAILREERQHVESGEPDANNNRIYKRTAYRVLELLDTGGTGPKWGNETFSIGGVNVLVRRFNIESGISPPPDPRVESKEQANARDLLSGEGGYAFAAYPFTNDPYVSLA